MISLKNLVRMNASYTTFISGMAVRQYGIIIQNFVPALWPMRYYRNDIYNHNGEFIMSSGTSPCFIPGDFVPNNDDMYFRYQIVKPKYRLISNLASGIDNKEFIEKRHVGFVKDFPQMAPIDASERVADTNMLKQTVYGAADIMANQYGVVWILNEGDALQLPVTDKKIAQRIDDISNLLSCDDDYYFKIGQQEYVFLAKYIDMLCDIDCGIMQNKNVFKYAQLKDDLDKRFISNEGR